MKKMCLLLIAAMTVPALASAEEWSNVSLVDAKCATKAKADPDAHTRSCALNCARNGFGILDQQGNFLKFDEKGNQEAMQLLENSSKKDHLRVHVTGEQQGDVIHVQSVTM